MQVALLRIDACIRNENVQLTPLVNHIRHETVYGLCIRDIGSVGEGGAA